MYNAKRLIEQIPSIPFKVDRFKNRPELIVTLDKIAKFYGCSLYFESFEDFKIKDAKGLYQTNDIFSFHWNPYTLQIGIIMINKSLKSYKTIITTFAHELAHHIQHKYQPETESDLPSRLIDELEAESFAYFFTNKYFSHRIGFIHHKSFSAYRSNRHIAMLVNYLEY